MLDFFKQATIDYLLGINLNAFAEFSEKMQTSDPGEIMRLKAIRRAAIDTATTTALGEGETRLHGWTLLSPTEAGQIESAQYEEKVVLVTHKALYCCESILSGSSRETLAHLAGPDPHQVHTNTRCRRCVTLSESRLVRLSQCRRVS